MPQFKSPPTLYDISFGKIRKWILKIAKAIYHTYGDYNSIRCQGAVSEFNQQLVSSVPAQIIDELFNSLDMFYTFGTATCDHCQSPYENHQAFDQRILVSMHANQNMKTLSAQRYVNDAFWKSTLPLLINLVRLDLNKVCTDEILEVVGKHCRILEFINIVSKSCHTRTKDRHNALKLQLCVSDVGLDFLSNCKELREVVMTCVIRKGCGGRQVTNEGLRRLLMSLPKLRRINYTDTGMLLDHMLTDCCLPLVSLTDYHPTALRIPRMEQLCPNLTELHLTFAFSSEDNRSDVISALCCSNLKISTLSLTNFSFDDALSRYLERKGNHLVVFNFVSSVVRSINELFRVLALKCPNLESMSMNFNLIDSAHINSELVSNLPSDKRNQFFCNLKSVAIKGVYWDFNYVLPLVLKQATSIKRITLNNHTYSGCLDETLQMIQQANEFRYLESVSFLKGMNISFQFLKTFIKSCPSLTNVTIESDSSAYFDLLSQLQQELKKDNYDVIVEIYGSAFW